MIQAYLSPFLESSSFFLLPSPPLQGGPKEQLQIELAHLCDLRTAIAAELVCVWLHSIYSLATRRIFALLKQNHLFFQPNVPCTDNVAFDVERLTRGQPASRRSALGDFANDSSLSLEPLRTSGMSQLPQDGELTPRSGEINIAVTSKFSLASSSVRCFSWSVALALLQLRAAGPRWRASLQGRGDPSGSVRGTRSVLEPITQGMTVPTLPLLTVYPGRSARKEHRMS